MQLQTTFHESKFPEEYNDAIFIQIDQHLKKLFQNTKGSRFYETRCVYTGILCILPLKLIPRLHETTRCQTGCTTGLTTGCIL